MINYGTGFELYRVFCRVNLLGLRSRINNTILYPIAELVLDVFYSILNGFDCVRFLLWQERLHGFIKHFRVGFIGFANCSICRGDIGGNSKLCLTHY